MDVADPALSIGMECAKHFGRGQVGRSLGSVFSQPGVFVGKTNRIHGNFIRIGILDHNAGHTTAGMLLSSKCCKRLP